LLGWIGTNDAKVRRGVDSLVGYPCWNNDCIPGLNFLSNAGFAPKLNGRGTTVTSQDFVSLAMVVMIGKNAVSPGISPDIFLKQLRTESKLRVSWDIFNGD